MMDYNRLKNYFIEFHTIQDRHISVCKNRNIIHSSNNSLPSDKTIDLDLMLFERNRAFENLRNALSLAPQSILTSFKEEVDNILNKDKIFMAALEVYKADLSKKISQSLKGKQLLKGYSTGSVKSLRFMNNKI